MSLQMNPASSEATEPQNRPRQAMILGWLTIIHIYRASALGLVINAAAGEVPAIFVVPGVGDFLAGITAPVIAFLLWHRRGLWVWLAAIVWHALALSDLLIGQSIQFLVQPENGTTPPAVVLVIALAVWVALDVTHVLSIVSLWRKPMRDYFLKPFFSVGGRLSPDQA